MWSMAIGTVVLALSAQLADVPWPAYRHDMQNTGLSKFKGPNVPKLLWTDTLPNYMPFGSPPIVVHDNSIFIDADDNGDPDDGLMFYDRDGHRNWIIKDKQFFNGGGIYGSSGVLFIIGYNGRVLNWIKEDGSTGTVFSAKDANEEFQALFLGRDNVFHFISYLWFPDKGETADPKLVTIDHKGDSLWTYPLKGMPDGMAVDRAGNIYLTEGWYVGATWHGVLLSVSPLGVTNWVFERQDTGFFVDPVIGHDGTIYMGTGHGLYALRPDGLVKWVAREDLEFRDPSLSPKGDIIIAGRAAESTSHPFLYSFASDGSLNWVYEKDPDGQEITISGPPVLDAEGTIYIGDSVNGGCCGYLRAISANGTLKWWYGVTNPTNLGVTVFAPAIGYCNRMYFIGNAIGAGVGNVLYALGEDLDGGVEDCSYPEVGYDDVGYTYDVGVDGGLADSGVDGASEDVDVLDSSDVVSDGGSLDVEASEKDTGVYRGDANDEVFVSAPGCGCATVGQ